MTDNTIRNLQDQIAELEEQNQKLSRANSDLKDDLRLSEADAIAGKNALEEAVRAIDTIKDIAQEMEDYESADDLVEDVRELRRGMSRIREAAAEAIA